MFGYPIEIRIKETGEIRIVRKDEDFPYGQWIEVLRIPQQIERDEANAKDS